MNTVALSPADQRAFADAIVKPDPPNERLQALANTQKLCGCVICKRLTPAEHGGLCSTGNIDAPVYQWICNECLKDRVIP